MSSTSVAKLAEAATSKKQKCHLQLWVLTAAGKQQQQRQRQGPQLSGVTGKQQQRRLQLWMLAAAGRQQQRRQLQLWVLTAAGRQQQWRLLPVIGKLSQALQVLAAVDQLLLLQQQLVGSNKATAGAGAGTKMGLSHAFASSSILQQLLLLGHVMV